MYITLVNIKTCFCLKTKKQKKYKYITHLYIYIYTFIHTHAHTRSFVKRFKVFVVTSELTAVLSYAIDEAQRCCPAGRTSLFYIC